MLGDAAGREDEARLALKQGGVSEVDSSIQAFLHRQDPTWTQSRTTSRTTSGFGPSSASPFDSTNDCTAEDAPRPGGVGSLAAKESDPTRISAPAFSSQAELAGLTERARGSASMRSNPDLRADVDSGGTARAGKLAHTAGEVLYEAVAPLGTGGFADSWSSAEETLRGSLGVEGEHEGKEMPVQKRGKVEGLAKQYKGGGLPVRQYTREELLAARQVEPHPQWPGWGALRKLGLSIEISPLGSGVHKSGKATRSAPRRYPTYPAA